MPTNQEGINSMKQLSKEEMNEILKEKKPLFTQPQSMRQLTFGEKAVGLTFNSGGNPKVESIKRIFASLIDELEGYRNPENAERHPEIARMLSVAITEAQSSQMWAVKAVTWQY